MKVDGSCHCGQISYEAEINPEKIFVCHCTDCQVLSGSPFRMLAPTRKGAFRVLSGEPKIYIKTGDSGVKRTQAFCPECGTPIFSSAVEDNPRFYNIRIGTIRQRDQIIPKIQIWCRSELPWLAELPTLDRVEKQWAPQ